MLVFEQDLAQSFHFPPNAEMTVIQGYAHVLVNVNCVCLALEVILSHQLARFIVAFIFPA